MSKHKKVKARRMWASDNTASDLSCDSELSAKRTCVSRNPLFVLPADAASYDAMAYQIGDKFWRAEYYDDYDDCLLSAKQALAAIGITRPTTKEKKA